MPTKRFIKACTPVTPGGKAPPRYMYTMQSLNKSELAPLRETLPDLRFLAVHDYRLARSDGGAPDRDACDDGDATGCGPAENAEESSDTGGESSADGGAARLPAWWAANLWMGGRGTRAQPHYDQAHNVFVQLRGQKTVWLAPPEHVADFYPFPSGHPASRQSRVSGGAGPRDARCAARGACVLACEPALGRRWPVFNPLSSYHVSSGESHCH